MAIERSRIRKPHLILCEGRDAEGFFINFLEKLGRGTPDFDAFQVFDFGGITQLGTFFETLSGMDGYDRVKSIAVVRDAETSTNDDGKEPDKIFKSAVDSVCSTLVRAGFQDAPKTPGEISKSNGLHVGFVLFPGCGADKQAGNLEEFCLTALAKPSSHDILSEIEAMVKKYQFKREHKNRLHCYFSLTDEYVGMKIGEACGAGAFHFDSPAMEALKNFLLRFFSHSPQ